MKTWEFSQALVIKSSQERLNIVCGRQFQTSVSQSVKHSIEEHISRLELDDEFSIQTEKIIQKVSGSVFEFKGLDRNITDVKGWDHVDILWIEEAETMVKEKLEIILPSIRKAGSEIWISFNRKKRDMAMDKKFLAKDISKTLKSESVIVKTHWSDNPNHPDTLEIERLICLETEPERYPHIWDGKPDDTGGKWKVLSYAKLLKCVDAHIKLKYKPSGMVYSGLDIADEGNDTNCWAKRQGALLSIAREWKVKYLHMTASKADFLNQENNVVSMYFDAGGMGAGIKSDLSRIKLNPNSGLGAQAKRFIPFQFGGKVKGPDKYFIKHKQLKIKNKDYFHRANSQLWWNIKLRVENTIKALDGESVNLDKCFFIDSKIDNIDKILSELSQCVYDDSSGKIVVDKAPDGADSPNVADGIILAYAHDIKKGLKAI